MGGLRPFFVNNPYLIITAMLTKTHFPNIMVTAAAITVKMTFGVFTIKLTVVNVLDSVRTVGTLTTNKHRILFGIRSHR